MTTSVFDKSLMPVVLTTVRIVANLDTSPPLQAKINTEIFLMLRFCKILIIVFGLLKFFQFYIGWYK